MMFGKIKFARIDSLILAHSRRILFVAWSKSGGKVYAPAKIAEAVGVMALYLKSTQSWPEHMGASSARWNRRLWIFFQIAWWTLCWDVYLSRVPSPWSTLTLKQLPPLGLPRA